MQNPINTTQIWRLPNVTEENAVAAVGHTPVLGHADAHIHSHRFSRFLPDCCIAIALGGAESQSHP